MAEGGGDHQHFDPGEMGNTFRSSETSSDATNIGSHHQREMNLRRVSAGRYLCVTVPEDTVRSALDSGHAVTLSHPEIYCFYCHAADFVNPLQAEAVVTLFSQITGMHYKKTCKFAVIS